MTGAEFVSGFTEHRSPFVELARPRTWLVRFRYSLTGEAPVVAQETVPNVTSEATAIRDGIKKRLGGVNRALKSLEMLEVRAIS